MFLDIRGVTKECYTEIFPVISMNQISLKYIFVSFLKDKCFYSDFLKTT